ncbi:GSCFA domain-containing protein [Rhizobium sp. LEGMi12c]
MTNPYAGIENYQLWRRSVARIETHLFDPVVNPKFRLDRATKIATAGSCFAQHISRQLQRIGFHYFVPENGEGLPEDERTRRNFGVFSGRYGNLYTARQLLQLFEEVFEKRKPVEKAWLREDGRYVDPYRPQIEPDGFKTIKAVEDERHKHLASIRAVFTEADVLVFTLGLTEAWRSRDDGSVFPLAPGVVAGSFDPERHEFVNFGVADVEADLLAFLEKLKDKNPSIKVLLTVSPVPLIATYEDRNVLVSTTYSKSVLRVVADQVVSRFDWVDYFPSYEIITGSYAGGLYYEADYREVNSRGVAHAMRCFVKNYTSDPSPVVRRATEPQAAAIEPTRRDIICDEEAIDAIRA